MNVSPVMKCKQWCQVCAQTRDMCDMLWHKHCNITFVKYYNAYHKQQLDIKMSCSVLLTELLLYTMQIYFEELNVPTACNNISN